MGVLYGKFTIPPGLLFQENLDSAAQLVHTTGYVGAGIIYSQLGGGTLSFSDLAVGSIMKQSIYVKFTPDWHTLNSNWRYLNCGIVTFGDDPYSVDNAPSVAAYLGLYRNSSGFGGMKRVGTNNSRTKLSWYNALTMNAYNDSSDTTGLSASEFEVVFNIEVARTASTTYKFLITVYNSLITGNPTETIRSLTMNLSMTNSTYFLGKWWLGFQFYTADGGIYANYLNEVTF